MFSAALDLNQAGMLSRATAGKKASAHSHTVQQIPGRLLVTSILAQVVLWIRGELQKQSAEIASVSLLKEVCAADGYLLFNWESFSKPLLLVQSLTTYQVACWGEAGHMRAAKS